MIKHSMKARVSQLHKTETAWNTLDSFIPLSGEVVLFDADECYDYVRVKIGDGKTLLKDLPFVIDSAITTRIKSLTEVIDAGRITKYINVK